MQCCVSWDFLTRPLSGLSPQLCPAPCRVPAPQHDHMHSSVSHRLSTAAVREIIAVLGCPPREPQSNYQPFWQTHFCPMLLCLIAVAVLDSWSLCCIHLNFSLASTCVCSPFPVWHCEGLGCLSWSRQHRGTACRAVLAHSDAGFFAKVKSGKRPFPKYAGLSQKMERRGKEANFRSW